MKKINDELNKLKQLYKEKYVDNKNVDGEIDKLEKSMIHPSDGAYFIIVMRLKNSKNKDWNLLSYIFFESKEDAQRRLKDCIAMHKNIIGNSEQFEIKIVRASLFETDITNVL